MLAIGFFDKCLGLHPDELPHELDNRRTETLTGIIATWIFTGSEVVYNQWVRYISRVHSHNHPANSLAWPTKHGRPSASTHSNFERRGLEHITRTLIDIFVLKQCTVAPKTAKW